MHHALHSLTRIVQALPMQAFLCSRAWVERVLSASTLAALVAALAAFAPDPAHAHAIVVGSTPAPNSTIAPGIVEIRLDFNSAIDRRLSSMTIACGGVEIPVTLQDAPPGVLDGRADLAPAGACVLHWQVLSQDGHITRGDVPFFVRSGGPSSR
jgi:copper resistance protein C